MMYSKEELYLMEKDALLKKTILKNEHLKLREPTHRYYHSMINLVISQFISTAAASSISNKILSSFDTKYFIEDNFKNLKLLEIKQLGLSRNKSKSVLDITHHFTNLEFTKKLNTFSENEFDQYFLSIYGIGPWTLSMFKMFSLGYRDVFSSKDAALRKGMNNANMVLNNANHVEYESYSEKWKPYRSLASMHIWKSLD
mgnify:CR=1 FL=1